jgi:hypothetical protein
MGPEALGNSSPKSMSISRFNSVKVMFQFSE